MAYQQFVDEALLDLRPLFPDYELSATVIEKIQGQSYYGLVVMFGGCDRALTMDLQPYFQRMCGGESYRAVISSIQNDIQGAVDHSIEDLIERIKDYAWVKDHLMIQPVSAEGNEDMLEKVPFALVLDFAIVFRIVFQAGEDKEMTVLITNELLESYGVEDEVLYEDAIYSAEKNCPAILTDAKNELPQLKSLRAGTIFMASCMDSSYGAAAIMYKSFLAAMAETFECGLYLIASSPYDLLIIPEDRPIMKETLQIMAQAMYESDESGGLSGSLFYYSKDIGEITIAG